MGLPLPDFRGVTSFVVGDLEAKEGMDGLEGFGIGGSNLDFGATRGVGVEVANLVSEFGHHRRAGRRGVVDEVGDVEVAGGETFRDVGEVQADVVPGGGVFGIVGGDVDGAAGFVQTEMVRGGFVGETHGVVSAGSDSVVVRGVRGGRGRLLGG